MKKILMLVGALLLSTSLLAQENVIKLTVRATFPDLDGDFTEAPSNNLKVLIGNELSMSAADGKQVSLVEVEPGVFSGEIDLGRFTIDDVRYVGWGTPWKGVPEPLFVYNAEGHTCVRANVPTNTIKLVPRQIQKKSGILDRFFMYAPLKLVKQDDGSYLADNVQLRHACAYVLFNIYGKARKMDKEEILRSVTITRYTQEEADENGIERVGNHINAQPFINAETGRIWNYINGRTSETVLLQEQCTLADRKKTDGVKVYMCTYGNGGPRGRAFSYIRTIKVETDAAVYTRTLDEYRYERSAGEVTTIDVDLSKFKRSIKE
ncbi:MAG: hypothetical protein IJS91_06900 [Bacteroidales bacterium]|nr:hypothetical protein [Bacteroidales bacterium]